MLKSELSSGTVPSCASFDLPMRAPGLLAGGELGGLGVGVSFSLYRSSQVPLRIHFDSDMLLRAGWSKSEVVMWPEMASSHRMTRLPGLSLISKAAGAGEDDVTQLPPVSMMAFMFHRESKPQRPRTPAPSSGSTKARYSHPSPSIYTGTIAWCLAR